MAVYTEVSFAEADALVQRLGLGALTELQGIGSGIENTNYYATTARGQWVLTLFERLSPAELPYYLALMQHLAARGIPVPAPQPAPDGGLVHTVAGKPASVVTRLPGGHRLAPVAGHCRQVGRMLARMHTAGLSLPVSQPHLLRDLPQHPTLLLRQHQIPPAGLQREPLGQLVQLGPAARHTLRPEPLRRGPAGELANGTASEIKLAGQLAGALLRPLPQLGSPQLPLLLRRGFAHLHRFAGPPWIRPPLAAAEHQHAARPRQKALQGRPLPCCPLP